MKARASRWATIGILVLAGCQPQSSGGCGKGGNGGADTNLRPFLGEGGRTNHDRVLDLVTSVTAAVDPTCPAPAVNGTTTTYTGGCTDSAGVSWFGSVDVTGDPAGDFTMTFTAFGQNSGGPCAMGTDENTYTVDGAVSLAGTAGATATFQETDLSIETLTDAATSCDQSTSMQTWTYNGTELATDDDGDGLADVFVYDGSGDSSQTGANGTISVSLVSAGETYDSRVCAKEALSGSTTITGSGHEGVLAYDGATDCDDPPTGQWTVDGEAAVEVTYGCTVVSPGRAGAAAPVALALLLGLVLFLRRRRR
jgi:MYXO-CTERM domain-containing protein